MKLTHEKWAIITLERPTLFVTERGELTEHLDEAELFDGLAEVVKGINILDEPEKFTKVKVTFSAEV